jgi:hypothetical protein
VRQGGDGSAGQQRDARSPCWQGIGAYRDEAGKPLVLRCVRDAEKKIANDETLNKEYLPIQVLALYPTLSLLPSSLTSPPLPPSPARNPHLLRA